MKNNFYYNGKNGDQIMNSNNFSKEIVRYLNYEQAYISKVLVEYGYSTLIELGCDEVRLHGTCTMNGVSYIGVDIRDELTLFTNKYFAENNDIYSKFVNSCISDFHGQLDTASDPILCVFPFNLIGNLSEYKSQITNCHLNGYDIIISQFNTTEESKVIRSQYYNKCGISDISLKETTEGDLFQGLNFESMSYNNNYIIECCKKLGYRHIHSYNSNLICIHYFKKNKNYE